MHAKQREPNSLGQLLLVRVNFFNSTQNPRSYIRETVINHLKEGRCLRARVRKKPTLSFDLTSLGRFRFLLFFSTHTFIFSCFLSFQMESIDMTKTKRCRGNSQPKQKHIFFVRCFLLCVFRQLNQPTALYRLYDAANQNKCHILLIPYYHEQHSTDTSNLF